ncbi:MAG: hypothetical protein RL112_1852, partial [Planctomycetota bacterium]
LRARADASQASRHRLVACLDLELAHAHLAAREFDEGAAAARAALAGFGPQAARHPLAFEAQGVLAGALLETGDARGALLAAEAHEAGWRTLAEADSARRLAADLLLARCGLVAHGKGHAPSLDRFGALELQLEGRAPDAEREPVSGEASLVAAVREELALARRALARD